MLRKNLWRKAIWLLHVQSVSRLRTIHLISILAFSRSKLFPFLSVASVKVYFRVLAVVVVDEVVVAIVIVAALVVVVVVIGMIELSLIQL